MIITPSKYAIFSLLLLYGALAEDVTTKVSARLENDGRKATSANSAQPAVSSPKLKAEDTEKIKHTKVVLPSTAVTDGKAPNPKPVRADSTATNSTAPAPAPSEKPLDASQDGLSPIIFLFCVVLTIVAVMLVARVVFSSKKRQFNTFGGNGFWTSRSSTQSGGRLSLGGGPALDISLGSGTAAYTAMPTQPSPFGHEVAVSEGGIRDPNLDWERHFFEHTGDDDEEHLTTNMEVEPAVGSKLQLNSKK